ncbi:MAG: hypothetical protein PHU14_01595 [Methylovulum sp.]|nr:hypothetical protein [Methylovulum sp.]
MNTFAFVYVFDVMPTSGSTFFGQVRKALADVWVCHLSEEEAEAKARAYILDQSWLIQSLQRTLKIEEKNIPDYRPEAQVLFYQAKAHGISAGFASVPLVDREGNTVEICRMAPPLHQSGNKH